MNSQDPIIGKAVISAPILTLCRPFLDLRLLAHAAILVVVSGLLPASAAHYVWTVGSRYDADSLNDNNSWFNSANWSPNGVPGTGDTASVGSTPYGNPDPVASLTLGGLNITGATVTVTLLTVDTLTLEGGSLLGGAVHFSGNATDAWTSTGGTVSGTFELQAGLSAHFAGSNSLVLRPNTTIENHGEIAWSGGDLLLGYGSVIRNQGVFLVSNDQMFLHNTGGAPVPLFDNAGIFRKSAGTGTTTFRPENGGVYFTNHATLDIQTGTVSFPARADFGHGGSLEGAGALSLEGTIGFHGTTTLAANSTLRLSGTLTGTDALLSGAGTLRWTGGTLAGTLTFDSALTCILEGDSSKSLSSSAQVLQRGPARWEGAGSFYFGWGTRWENAGQFDVLNDAIAMHSTGGSPAPEFVNTGTLRKSASTGTTTFRYENSGIRFSGTGLVDVQSGTLQLNGGGTLTHPTFQIASGAMVGFGNHTFLVQSGLAFSGGGLARINGATLTLDTLTSDLGPNTTFELASGTLAGTSSFSGSGLFLWTGGSLGGSLDVPASLGFEIAGSNTKTFQPNTLLTNHTAAVWRETGGLHLGNGTAFYNLGSLDIRNDQMLLHNTGGTPVPLFDNAGIFRKSVGTGTTTFRPENGGVYFTNHATLDIQTGTVSFPARADFGHGGSLEGAGALSLEGTIGFHGTTTLAANSTLRLSGTLTGTDALLSGAGTLRWTGGTLAGTLTLDSAFLCILEGDSSKSLSSSAQVLQRGPARWEGAGSFYFGWGTRWENAGQFDVLNDAIAMHSTGGSPAPEFVNTGTLRKSASTGTTTFRYENSGIRFSGTGLVDVQSGTLQLNGGGTLTHPTFQIASGAMVGFGNHTFLVQSGLAFSGGGLARINGATLTLNTLTSDLGPNTTFELASGTLAGTSSFSGSGLFLWTGGSLGGSLNVPASLGFEIAGSNTKTFQPNTLLTNHTAAVWRETGGLHLGNGTAFYNLGSLDIRNDQMLLHNTGGTPVPLFDNAGIFRKSAGTGTTTFRPENGGVYFTNHATLDIQTGTVSFPARADFGHGGSLEGAGALSLEGTIGFHGTTTLAANSTLRLSGTLTGTDALLSGPGTLRWINGFLAGTLTFDSALTCILEGDAAKTLTPSTQVLQRGPARWEGSGNFNLGWGARWENAGHFDILNDANVSMNTGGTPAPQFVNTGTLRKSASTGTTTFRHENGGVGFVHRGTVELRTGRLQINGTYEPGPGAAYSFIIGGPSAGTDYGSVGRNGTMPFDGPISVTLGPGYTPASGAVFVLATYTAQTGEFHPVTLPPLPEPQEWALRYLPTSLELRALAGAPHLEITEASWSPPGIFQGLVVGANVREVQVEATTDFASWSPVATQIPFEGSFTFTDPDSGAFTNRVYRARELP